MKTTINILYITILLIIVVAIGYSSMFLFETAGDSLRYSFGKTGLEYAKFNFFKSKKVKIFKVPSIDNLAINKGAINNLTPFKIEDLLKRDQISIDLEKNKIQYFRKTILVTGAAGSIGSEIVRQCCRVQR